MTFRGSRSLNLAFSVGALVLVMTACAVAAEPQPSGEQIYRTRCASCHGAKGEGTKQHAEALVGDRSVLELARLIEKTMPEDDPTKCVGEDARQVAVYIHEAFYSPTAQARNKPARIELSRLTVRQYQQTVADLIGGFRNASPPPSDKRGLRGEYFAGRRFSNQDRALDRIDPTVQFDFGVGGPVAEKTEGEKPEAKKFEPHQFSIKWQGALFAAETGEYEFIVRTEHAARLWINDTRDPLIDAWVKSGPDTEFRGSLRLLGGRVYPLRLEYSKAKQGVDDSKDKKNLPAVKSSISLHWKLAHRVAEIIPERSLSPLNAAEVFVLQTPFPPDDRSYGYERGTSISKAWDQATTSGAIEVAGYVSGHLQALTGVAESAEDRGEKLRGFCYRFAERAFRRPLSEEQKKLYVDRQFDEVADPALAVKRCVLLVLKSPRFLYREPNTTDGDPYDVAARLSFGLWDSMPDQELLKAAAAGQLATREQVVRQAERMLVDLRARAKLREFFMQWLKVDQIPDLAKDSKQFPEFTPEVAADLRTSLELFIDDVIWSDASDFRRLLLSDTLPLNGRLAKFYGVTLPADAPFEQVPLDANRRSGVLTHPYLLASLAYTGSSSPIHRGVLISRSMLGRVLRPPPEAFTPFPPELHASLSTRERVALQTKSKVCISCHGMINPLGFTLEHFDAVGRFRNEENGKPIDASGEYLSRAGQRVQFAGVRDLAAYLAESDETHAAFVSQLFHHLVKQSIRAYGPQQLPELQKTLEKNGYSVRKLAVEIVASAAFPPKKTP